MSRNFLCSDMSEDEAYLLTAGELPWGTDNKITGLFKFVGKYTELKSYNRENEIIDYLPDEDKRFKYENAGYTEIGKHIEDNSHRTPRRFLKSLSRKWCLSRVKISFDTIGIIQGLFSYITQEEALNDACQKYLLSSNMKWDVIMPIQHEFLGKRLSDKRKDWKVSERIVLDLPTLTIGAKP